MGNVRALLAKERKVSHGVHQKLKVTRQNSPSQPHFHSAIAPAWRIGLTGRCRAATSVMPPRRQIDLADFPVT